MIYTFFIIFQYLNFALVRDNQDVIKEGFNKAPLHLKIIRVFMFFLPSLVILSLCFRSL